VSEVTRILDRVQQGETRAAEELLPLVYDELRKLAAYKLAHEAPGQTLQPTALVHEVWLRMVGSSNQQWHGRNHFFTAAAEGMRRILIDSARRKHSLKRGAGAQRVDLDQVQVAAEADEETLLLLNEALEKLAAEDAPAAEVVNLRFFVGLSNAETAEALGISERSVKRCWAFARAWLYHEVQAQHKGC
jgi:RNA polymerase sigma factor (TIGR02999 family)